MAAGRLLVLLGAEVVKVERPGGDPLRGVAPRTTSGASVPFAYYNAGKHAVVAGDGDEAAAEVAAHVRTPRP